jgi:F0F1-type ATP synthase membrane subunit c/vacuolar-type H+-ATPase subunit K
MIFLFILQFLKELKSGVKYLVFGLVGFLVVMAGLLGLSWCSGFLVDKLLNIEQLNPTNYVVYGTYILLSILAVSAFLLAILMWILLAYKAVMDKTKHG